MSRAYPILLVLTVGCVMLLMAGCRQPELDSRWRKDVIHIDGELSDWRNSPPYYINNSPVAVGFSNDADYLYLRLSSRDPHLQRQIMAGSLTIWFDPACGRQKTFGIGFPLAAQNPTDNKAAISRETGGQNVPPQAGRQQLELIGADEKMLARLDAEGSAQGIEVAMNRQGGDLLYELKLPLAVTAGQPFAIGVKTNAQIGIGLVTKRLQRPNKSAAQGQASGRGESRGGGKGGGSGRGGGGRGTLQAEPLNLWVTLQLAPAPKVETRPQQG